MPVTRKPNINEVERKILVTTSSEHHVKAIVTFLSYIGEKCVNRARQNDTYLDQTGNLRSSIGYCVVHNGKIENISCREAERGTEKSSGVREGKSFMKDLAKSNSEGFVLIIVAGMNYATYVEAKGFDVLTNSRLYAETKVPMLMKQLNIQ